MTIFKKNYERLIDFSEKREFLSASIFFLLLIAVFFFPVIFSGKTLTTSVFWGGVMNNGPYNYQGERPPLLPVRDPGAFAWADEPLTQYIGNVIKNSHHVPLWNPNMGLGYPILGGIQLGIFFPLNYINFLFSSELSWDIFFLIRIFLAGFFTYAFARKLGLTKIPSYVAGIIFMFSGYTIEFLNMSHFSSEALIPLVLLATEYFLEKKNAKSFALYTVALALAILPGMPEATFFVFSISFLWFIFSLFFLHQETYRKERIKMIFFSVGANIVALALTSIQLLPFLELLKNSFNTHSASAAGSIFSPPNVLFSLFSPFISNPAFNWIGETISYLGIAPFVLSMLAVFNWRSLGKKKIKILLFFSIFCFLGLAKCFGIFFINWIGELPILQTLIFPKYGIPSIMFAFSILAGLGLTVLIRKEIRWLNLKIILILGIIASTFFYMLRSKAGTFLQNVSTDDARLNQFFVYLHKIIPLKIPSIFFEKNRALLSLVDFALIFFLTLTIFLIFWIIILVFFHKKRLLSFLIIAFVFFEYFLYALPLIRLDRYETYKKAPYVEFLEKEKESGEIYRIYAQAAQKVQPSVLYSNISSVFGFQDIRFLLALGEKRYFKFLEKGLKTSPDEIRTIRFTGDYPISLENKYLDIMNVKYFIVPKDYQVNENKNVVYDKEVKIIQNEDYLPKVFIVHKARVLIATDDIFNALDGSNFDFKKEIIIEKDFPENKLIENNTPLEDNSKANIIDYKDEQVTIATKMENDGFLVLLDQYYPGWKAYVDGKETEIYPTDYVFRSIYLNKGDHQIEFIYNPSSYKIGKLISIVTLLFVLFLFFNKNIRKVILPGKDRL